MEFPLWFLTFMRREYWFLFEAKIDVHNLFKIGIFRREQTSFYILYSMDIEINKNLIKLYFKTFIEKINSGNLIM